MNSLGKSKEDLDVLYLEANRFLIVNPRRTVKATVIADEQSRSVSGQLSNLEGKD